MTKPEPASDQLQQNGALDMLRKHLPGAIPYVKLTGLEYEELAPGRATVVLPDSRETRNHVDTQHAGALFTVGESASGAAFTAAFLEHLNQVRPVVSDAVITYLAPARGAISATAVMEKPTSELLSEIADHGRTRFTVDVTMVDAKKKVVANMTVSWHVSAI